ncbi:membrane protein [Weissella minor]|uniref:Membrane protein n=1 Tax=Weissella minor TaxID=1620 RepID=A0A0R2JHT6_9LACO|nr:membrane protein [Weissella minor]
MLSQADALSHGVSDWQSTYFWRYPNNVSIAYFLSLWLKFTQLFGITTNLALHILSMLTLDVFIGLMLKTMYQISHQNRRILLGGLAFMALTPFAYTYFLQVFYSDLPSLLLLLIIFRIFFFWSDYSVNKRWFMGLLLVFIATVAQLLKPNIIVMVPAILIVFAILMLKKQHTFVKLILPTLLIFIGFGLSVPAKQAIFHETQYQTNEKYELPSVSWMAMGLNPETAGMYNGKDIARELELPDKAARTEDQKKLIVTRIKDLGPIGLMKQWFNKLAVFLNAAYPQNYYNGGLREAPHWVQKHSGFYNVSVSLMYQVATILLFGCLIYRLWSWRPEFKTQAEVVSLITVITILGYMGFHTFVWETEPRYGQIILPLVLFAVAAVPAPVVLKHVSSHERWHSVAFPTIAMISLIIGAKSISVHFPTTHVAAAQRSQLSPQYGAKMTNIDPNSVVSQRITLNGTANKISLQVHTSSEIDVTFENLKHKQSYKLTKHDADYIYEGKLPAGVYELRIVNDTNQPQPLDIVSTENYHLANDPIKIHGHTNKNASLIYKVLY